VAANQTKSSLPPGIAEYYLPQTYSLPEAFRAAGATMPAEALIQGVVYRPALIGSAQIRFLDRKMGVDSTVTRAALIEKPERSGTIRWDDFLYRGTLPDKLDTAPAPGARFGMVDPPLNDLKRLAAMQKDFIDWIYRNSSVKARVNQLLKVFGGPDVSQAEFIEACADAARVARDAESAKTVSVLDRKIKALKDKLEREQRELEQDRSELGQRKTEELGNLAELGASIVGIGRKKTLTSQLTKRRLTEHAKGDVEDSIQTIAQYQKDLSELQAQRDQVAAEINDRWGQAVNDISEVRVSPKKTDIYVPLFGVAWMPYYIVASGGKTLELRAFGPE
jgi:hypothetical protein